MNETTQQNRLFDNKKLAALLIPLAVDQLLNSFMGTVDTLVVSNLGSAADFSSFTGRFDQYPDCSGFLCTGIRWNSCVFPLPWMWKKGACTGGSKTVGFHYVRIVGGDCWNVSFIQWSDVGTDLWKSRECGYGECQKVFFLFCNLVSIYRII